MHDFTFSQSEAILHPEGPTLIIAGPGSGKTTVFVQRIYHLIYDIGSDPSRILAITFTNEAAQEMRSRFLTLCGLDDTLVTFGTFHSVFYSLLRHYIPDFDLTPADRGTALNILKHSFMELFGTLPGSDRAYMMLSEISRVKNFMSNGNDIIRKLIPVYNKKLHALKLMDYDDMLVMLLKLIKSDTLVLNDIRLRYTHILIDEFQDIDRLQFEIVRLIAAPVYNIFAVGDDDQSIYGFRGADPAIMLSFRKNFQNASLITLRENFRCPAKVGKMAGKLIKHNRSRYPKDIYCMAKDGEPPDIRSFRRGADETGAVIDIIRDKAPGETIGILYRTRRAGSDVVSSLIKMGISGADNVYPMTFHAAKGLEFDTVVIVHANESITPGKAKVNAVLEEERRMFYVAATRTKKSLHIFNTLFSYNAPDSASRFLREMGR